MTGKQLLILRLLMDHPNGLYGSEFVELSHGTLKRGSIYTTLDRMTAEGLMTEALEAPEAPHLAPRTRHLLSAAGRRVFEGFLCEHRLMLAPRSLA